MDILNKNCLDEIQDSCLAHLDNPVISEYLKKIILELGSQVFLLQHVTDTRPEEVGYETLTEYLEATISK